MTDCTFTAHIDGATIACTLTPGRAIAAPVLCFSLMAPPAVLSGGTLIRSVGGYGEVQLPDLIAGQTHHLTLAHENPDFRPVNRAWLPLGAYLRSGDTIIPLPSGPAGVIQTETVRPPAIDGLRLVPPPTAWDPTGDTIHAAAFGSTDPRLASANALAQRIGQPALLSPDGVRLTLSTAELDPESYSLDIQPDAVKLSAADDAGFHYGAVTLMMLRATHAGLIPTGRITDTPRFPYRGQHLDCARHFYQPATIHRLLDLMALFKMNHFHWHFSDDEAFRLQVDCAPDAWTKTAFRGEGELVPGVFGGGPRAGGTYSKADARAVIDHAAGLHIAVLPEIEVPAHALGLAAALPGLRDLEDTGTERSVQGYAANVLNPAMPATWDLLEALSLEVADLFPLGMLHLGCDELPPDTWAGSPAVAALKRQEGLTTRDDVQEWTMQRLARHLTRNGVKVAAWEEAARGQHGGVGHGALLFSWTGQGPGIDAARAGYDVVMSPAQHVYLDMAHTGDADDWGAAWAAFVSLADTIDWQVIPNPAIADRIKGVEGTFWSEFTTDDRQIEPMIAPRILGVATKAWSGDQPITADDLTRLAWHHGDLFDAMGWNWRRP